MVAGDTRIEGTSYIPKRGVKPGTIAGHSYYGEQLIYGQQRTSSTLPKLQNELLDQVKMLKAKLQQSSSYEILSLEAGKTFKNSFFEQTQLVYSLGDLYISEVNLIGNIIIYSNTKIIVDASSSLKDVILVAPKIELRDGVKGTLQAIASKEILINKNVELQYPSALTLIEEKGLAIQDGANNIEPIRINVGQDSMIEGLVIFVGQPKPNNFKSQISIQSNSTVKGEVYCNQNLELKGIVSGSVFTSNFVANESGSLYQNHIFNGKIAISNLTDDYIGLLFNNSKKGVAKWLY